MLKFLYNYIFKHKQYLESIEIMNKLLDVEKPIVCSYESCSNSNCYDNKNGKLEITFTFDDLSASYVLELDKFKYKNFNILCDVAESMKRGKK